MLRTIKNTFIISLLVFLSVSPVTNAQSTSFEDKATNLGQYLLLQFDATDILEDFKTDLLLNENSCKQIDKFQVLSAQSDLADRLLLDFETLNEQERQSIINNYQTLEIEYQFLNNISSLIQNGFQDGQPQHIRQIKQDLPQDLRPQVDSIYNSLAVKYEPRIQKPDPDNPDEFIEGDYLNCPTSWSSLKERAQNLQLEVQQISEEWESLKQAFQNLKKSSADAVSPANLKSIFVDKPINSISNSVQATIQNLKSEIQRNQKEFNSISTNPIQTYQKVLQENETLLTNRADIAGLLLGNSDITQVTQELSEKSQLRQLFQSKIEQHAINQITAQHFDLGIQNTLNIAYQTPLLVSYNKEVFTETNQEGLLNLSKQVYDRQCVVNP